MERKKLKLLPKAGVVSLLLSGLLYIIGLFLLFTQGSWWTWLVYIGISIYLYRKFFYKTKGFIWFGVGIILASLWAVTIVSSPALSLLISIVFGVLLMLLLGLEISLFHKEEFIVSILFYSLVYILLALFSFSVTILGPWGQIGMIIILFLSIGVMLRDVSYLVLDTSSDIVILTYAFIASFLTMQMVWMSSLFSFGFLYGASLSTVFLILFSDTFLRYKTAQLTKNAILQNSIFLVLFSVGIVLLSLV